MQILVANLATKFQDLFAKVKNLVTLAPVLGAIWRPAERSKNQNQSARRSVVNSLFFFLAEYYCYFCYVDNYQFRH